jgi:hypothetical protein
VILPPRVCMFVRPPRVVGAVYLLHGSTICARPICGGGLGGGGLRGGEDDLKGLTVRGHLKKIAAEEVELLLGFI